MKKKFTDTWAILLNKKRHYVCFYMMDLPLVQPDKTTTAIQQQPEGVPSISFGNICFQYGHQKILGNFNDCGSKGDFEAIPITHNKECLSRCNKIISLHEN